MRAATEVVQSGMRIVLAVAALTVLLAASTSLRAEDPPAPTTFPETFRGHWVGTCRADMVSGKDRSFAMELRVEPIEGKGAWTWEITYGEGEKRQVRPYELLPVEGEPGHYVIDEKNSIVIDAYVLDRVVCSRFWVANSVIDASYRRDGDNLIVTLTTFGEKPARMSGGKDRIPSVASYPLRAIQRAVLTRKP